MSGTPIDIPRVNANEDAVEFLKRWVDDGSLVSVGQLVADLGTSKASIGVESPAAGAIVFVHAEGDTIDVGATLAFICATDEDAAAARRLRSRTGDGSALAETSIRTSPVRISRAAKQFLDQQGVDASSLPIGGLVSSRRAKRHASGGTRIELDWIKRAEVQALTRASDALASSVSMPAPLSSTLRAASSALPTIICEAAKLLARYPVFNACFDDDAIVQYADAHVGVAMDLGRGLRVVTIRGAASIEPAAAEQALYDFTLRYLDDTLQPEDMTGSTFTVTDLSSFGVTGFQPIVNDRQSAILGVGAGPSADSLTLTLVFDHRVSNGRTAAMFLADLRDALGGGTPASTVVDEPIETTSPAMHAAVETTTCDRCGMTLEAYYERYPGDAMMTVHMRPSGALGLMCHICASGAF